MPVIAITGAAGFLGWHLRCHLLGRPGYEVIPVGRAVFDDASALDGALRNADAVVHLAGVNRASDEDIKAINVDLAKRLIDSLERVGAKPSLIYSSTTHVERTSVYGQAKKEAGDRLAAWAERTGAPFVNMVIPHIFGEHCRPFYNSAVATFCYQVASGQETKVENDAQLELIHAQEVAAAIVAAIEARMTGTQRLAGLPISVSEVLSRIKTLAESYAANILPRVEDDFSLALFNTYRSYLFPDRFPVVLHLHSDDRGSLFEAVKGHNGGQTFVSTTRPGITRGEHYHYRKIERFLVIGGKARIRIRRLFDDRVHEFLVSGDEPAYIDMPTLHTHNIANVGDTELLTLFWSNEIFDPEKPDTIREMV